MLSLDEINQNIISFVSDVKYDKTLTTFYFCLLLLSSILDKCAALESAVFDIDR